MIEKKKKKKKEPNLRTSRLIISLATADYDPWTNKSYKRLR
jgi:hypothetical protein